MALTLRGYATAPHYAAFSRERFHMATEYVRHAAASAEVIFLRCYACQMLITLADAPRRRCHAATITPRGLRSFPLHAD